VRLPLIDRKFIFALIMSALLASKVYAAGDATRGEKLFARCSACHSIDNQTKFGPQLSGVLNRVAGTLPGAHYSKALSSSGITWTAQELDAFLEAPRKKVPGTIMTTSVPDSQDRADIIAFLAMHTRP